MKLFLLVLILWRPLAGAENFVTIGACREVDSQLKFEVEMVLGTTTGQFKAQIPGRQNSAKLETVTEPMSIQPDGRGGYVASFMGNSFFAMVFGLRTIELPLMRDFKFTNAHQRTYSCRANSFGNRLGNIF